MVLTVQEYGAKIGKRSNFSADAIQICMEKDIWILFLDSYGNPKREILPFSGGSSPIYKRKKLLFWNNGFGKYKRI